MCLQRNHQFCCRPAPGVSILSVACRAASGLAGGHGAGESILGRGLVPFHYPRHPIEATGKAVPAHFLLDARTAIGVLALPVCPPGCGSAVRYPADCAGRRPPLPDRVAAAGDPHSPARGREREAASVAR